MAYHLLLSARSRRGIGFACSWSDGGAVKCLAIAVEDGGGKFSTTGESVGDKKRGGFLVVFRSPLPGENGKGF